MREGRQILKVALAGNPNTGKSSLFNALTGLNQKVSNYPGITVEKKTGTFRLNDQTTVQLVDLPGTYSLHASSPDEEIVLSTLTEATNPDRPDVVIVVADVTNLKRNLYLFTQIADLGFPCILALNLSDQIDRKGLKIDVEALEKRFEIPVISISARNRKGIDLLLQALETELKAVDHPLFEVPVSHSEDSEKVMKERNLANVYGGWLWLTQGNQINGVSSSDAKKWRISETVSRYNYLEDVIQKHTQRIPELDRSRTAKLDRVLVHPVWGVLILFGLLFLLFQAIYAWAEVPMNLIDTGFSTLSEQLSGRFPDGFLSRLFTEGVIPGIAGVVIFLPQIIILFAAISFLEESGYMSRVVFLMDNMLRRFGLSGKSVVPLISGTACAIPAIMATRNIENWKERILTIFVTPFMTCSARLPVYAVLIGLVIPSHSVLGMELQGLVLLGMYMIGFIAALGASWGLSRLLRDRQTSHFIVEMPSYRRPHLRNVVLTIYEKSRSFVVNAGKIILLISVLLWILASNGPGAQFHSAEQQVLKEQPGLQGEELNLATETHRLEHSYIGILGRAIEPAIRPLGYDWKIGIALISSFAAREVFVGTMATIYSVGSDEEQPVLERLRLETNAETGKPFFNLAVGISLLLFYAFAMQCVSTVSVVKQETNGWKWPLIQMVSMTGLAYVVALIAFQILK